VEGNKMVDETQMNEIATQDESEKMLPQSEVNSLIGRAKAEAQEKARRQLEQEFQAKIEELNSQKQNAQQKGMDTKDIDVDKIYEDVHSRFAKEMEQRQYEQHMNNIANSYQTKIDQGSKQYEDFDQVTKDFDPAEFPQLVYLIAGMDNAADILYELNKNPNKLATIDYLSQRSPKRAYAEINNIGKSIAANKAALEEEKASQADMPLDRLTPSNKTGSNGQMSVSDLRSQPWLAG
jgi:hypothetical protein